MELTVAEYRALIRAEGASLLAQFDRLTPDDWTRLDKHFRRSNKPSLTISLFPAFLLPSCEK
jgi:hypothetical protein